MTAPWAPPSFRRMMVLCSISWGFSILGAALCLWVGSWLVLPWALSSAVSTGGWLLAVRQWMAWRQLAVSTLAVSVWLSDHPPSSDL